MTVIRMGDGSQLCAKHRAEYYPGVEEPETGWIEDMCDECAYEEMAAEDTEEAEA